MTVPARPQLFHITHVDNLQSIVAAGGLHSDAAMIARNAGVSTIGMSSIKRRRLTLPVRCHPGDSVGECAPFYFCPRSIMLFLIHRANHPDLDYRGGQEPIVQSGARSACCRRVGRCVPATVVIHALQRGRGVC